MFTVSAAFDEEMKKMRSKHEEELKRQKLESQENAKKEHELAKSMKKLVRCLPLRIAKLQSLLSAGGRACCGARSRQEARGGAQADRAGQEEGGRDEEPTRRGLCELLAFSYGN